MLSNREYLFGNKCVKLDRPSNKHIFSCTIHVSPSICLVFSVTHNDIWPPQDWHGLCSWHGSLLLGKITYAEAQDTHSVKHLTITATSTLVQANNSKVLLWYFQCGWGRKYAKVDYLCGCFAFQKRLLCYCESKAFEWNKWLQWLVTVWWVCNLFSP